MVEQRTVSGLPFACTPNPAYVWSVDAVSGVVNACAEGHTDLYVNPAGSGSADAESLDNAATLLGLPPAGDFQFAARVQVEFESTFDAGVLLVWKDATTGYVSRASTGSTRTTPPLTGRTGDSCESSPWDPTPISITWVSRLSRPPGREPPSGSTNCASPAIGCLTCATAAESL